MVLWHSSIILTPVLSRCTLLNLYKLMKERIGKIYNDHAFVVVVVVGVVIQCNYGAAILYLARCHFRVYHNSFKGSYYVLCLTYTPPRVCHLCPISVALREQYQGATN